MKSFSRSFPIILISCSIVIGAALTYLVLISWDSAIKSISARDAQITEQRVKSDVLPDQNAADQVATTTAIHESEILTKTLQLSDTVERLYSKALASRSISKQGDQLSVNWSTAEEIPKSEWGRLLGGVLTPEAILRMSTSTVSGSGGDMNGHVWIEKIWRVGAVIEGSYSGGGVYTLKLSADYPFFGANPLEIVRSEDGLNIAVVRRSETQEDPKAQASELGLPVESEILDLYGGQFPDTLTVKGRKFVLSSVYSLGVIYDDVYPMVDSSRIKYVATSEEGVELYQDISPKGDDDNFYIGDGCLFALMADGTWMRYSTFLPAYLDEKMTETVRGGSFQRTRDPGLRWASDYENANEYYGVSMSGCGFGVCSDVMYLAPDEEKDLVQVGTEKTTNDPIYTFQHPEQSRTIQALYDMWYNPSQSSTGEKPSLHEMISTFKAPVFFWKDPIGRWNRYTVSELQPAVECGKPVIYLYPETQTDVHVSLPKFINVTVSDPHYPSAGWNVTASPNGDLLSHADRKTYGSLYWEGTGVAYQAPKTGFIIKDGDVSSFFISTLPKYGLNQKEANEFMDFWIPQLTGAPYYRISFLTDEWSKAAPLFVSPRPKTSIRIFMDWQPLSAPISITPPKIVTRRRDGFTLVEWGGTLYKR